MTDKYNIQTGRAGILNLISQRERGFLFNSQYKSNVTKVKVNQLPKFSDLPTVYSDVDDGYFFNFLRSGTRGNLFGVGEYHFRTTTDRGLVCVFEFTTHNSVGKDASIITSFSKRYFTEYCFVNMPISDIADLSYRNQKMLLIVGNLNFRKCAALLSPIACDYVHQGLSWKMDDQVFCCAGDINSENFVLGCTYGFYVCKSFKLSKKYHLQDSIIAAEFNNDGNLFFISDLTNGIQLCDMRENIESSLRNSLPYIKEPAVSDPSFCAMRMKLLSDQVTLIASSKTGHIKVSGKDITENTAVDVDDTDYIKDDKMIQILFEPL
ncbi:hypothetical protein AVEN_188408-1 [Araneus ventricosus]|uniref:Uncharacterized protein n=1 Tax=Araneus ventricosus TaxID=182803 RepID=A0A4Y2T2L1_ARAVE|nr:hypothetical protein AVEN_188408-1 [Araneus ventricosus]